MDLCFRGEFKKVEMIMIANRSRFGSTKAPLYIPSCIDISRSSRSRGHCALDFQRQVPTYVHAFDQAPGQT
jgi:hypothetical protein